MLARPCGRTVSRNLAEFMRESPTLKNVEIRYSSFHEDFFSLLAAKGRNSSASDLILENTAVY